jgi:hypothetical protein
MAQAQSQKIPENWKEIFVAALAKSPNVTAACQRAKVSRSWAYAEREANSEFAAAWDEALEMGVDEAQGELHRRAVKGVLEPVFYQGEEVGHIRRYSDTLLMFLLKAHRPEVYRETVRSELTGANGGPIEQRAKVDHAIDSSTAESIFDVLAAAGVFNAALDDAKDDQVHPT